MLVNLKKLREISGVTQKLAEVFDYVLVDCPAGAGKGFKTCLAGVDEVILVVTPHIVSIRDADRVLGIILGSGITNPMFVINRIRGDLVIAKNMLSHIEISTVLAAKLIGVVPESDQVSVYSSVNFSRFLSGDVENSLHLTSLALHRNKKVIFDYKKKFKGLRGYFRRKAIEKNAS